MKKRSLLLIPMMVTLFSCQQEVKKTQSATTPNSIEPQISTKAVAGETDKARAARLARVGEILVNNPVGVTHAHDLFAEALTLDPQNNKALFYSAFTEILMSMEGSVKRAKSLFENPEDYDTYLDYLREKVKYPEFVNFVIGKANKADFKNYQDIKRFMQNEVVDAFEAATAKLNKIDGDVNIILTQLKTTNEVIEYDCHDVTEDGATYTSCDLKEEMRDIVALPAQTVTVDTKDAKMVASGLKGYSTLFKLYTAYSIEGQKHLTNEVQVREIQVGRSLTDKEMHRIVRSYSNYLVLEKDNRMGEIVRDLEGIIEVGMDLETLNNQFCDNDLRKNNLIKTICFTTEARQDMEQALEQLAGPKEVSLGLDATGKEVKILVDLPAYLSNPVQDLKTLIPTEYYDDGSSKYTTEPNLNGLFPNKDLLEKLKQLKSE